MILYILNIQLILQMFVLLQNFVKNRVGYAVAHLVGMSLGHLQLHVFFETNDPYINKIIHVFNREHFGTTLKNQQLLQLKKSNYSLLLLIFESILDIISFIPLINSLLYVSFSTFKLLLSKFSQLKLLKLKN